MEWKTAKEMASELGVTQSAVYEGIKRGGRVGGETLEKGGPGGRRYRIKAERPRIPKPPLTIKEEPSELDGDVWARFEKLEKLVYDLTEGERVKRTIATDSIKQRLESIGETLSVHSREFDTQDTKIKHRTLTSDARLTDLHERMKKLEKTDEKRENFDIRSYLDGKVKEHVEMMIKATFELPDHGSDIERLSEKTRDISNRLTNWLDLWTSKIEEVEHRLEHIEENSDELRHLGISDDTLKHLGITDEIVDSVFNQVLERASGGMAGLEERLGGKTDRLSERLEFWKSVSEYVDRELARRFDVDEIKSRIAKLQDRLAEATKNGGEYRNQVNERLDLQHKIQCQQLTSMKELKEHAQDNVERIIALESADLNIHTRLLSLESFEQEFARRMRTAEEKVTAIISGRPALDTKERIDGINARLLEVEETLKAFNWDGFGGRPKRGEVIGLIRGGVQEELKRIGKQEDNQSKAILNDIGRLFKRVVDLESVRTIDEEFKRDTNRSIETLIKNVMRLQGLSVDKTPSAADIMKRTVKAASAFADAMKGDL